MYRVERPHMQKLALGKAAIVAGAPVRLHVSGLSMLPALWPGDLITVRHAATEDLRRGAIVAFARDDRIVVHRIVGQTANSNANLPITRGDSQQEEDLPVLPGELLGIVASVRRFGVDRPIAYRSSLIAQILSKLVLRSALARLLLFYLSRLKNWLFAARWGTLLTRRLKSGAVEGVTP